MNKKSLIKISALGSLILISAVLLFILMQLFLSTATVPKGSYRLGESVRINLEEYNNYTLKIITPSTTFKKYGNDKSILFNPVEIGNYTIIIISKDKSDSFDFSVIDDKYSNDLNKTIDNIGNFSYLNFSINQANLITTQNINNNYSEEIIDDYQDYSNPIVNQPYTWKETIQVPVNSGKIKIKIPKISENVSIFKEGKKLEFATDDSIMNYIINFFIDNENKNIFLENISGNVSLYYTTQGPKEQEENLTDNDKDISIYSPDNLDYKNVLSYANIDETLPFEKKDLIELYWNEENVYLPFDGIDTNNNSLIDKIQWITPHLSNQTFKITQNSRKLENNSVYILGQKIIIDLSNKIGYQLNINGPSLSVNYLGTQNRFIFKPNETGDYNIKIKYSGIIEAYLFSVIKNNTVTEQKIDNSKLLKPIKVNEPVVLNEKLNIPSSNTRTKINIPKSDNISVYKILDSGEKQKINDFSIDNNSNEVNTITLNGVSGNINIEYDLPAPEKEEKTIDNNTKEVKVFSTSEYLYENVSAYTEIPRLTKDKNQIKIYWKEENVYITDFNAIDLDNDSYLDHIDWIVPHLSNQTFDIIIITKAEHLDSSKNFISDIYDSVKSLDDNWSEQINDNEYVRVTFEKNLTNINDITIYPRIVSGNPKIEVYPVDSGTKITEFNPIISDEYNKVYLTNLTKTQNTFYLKVLGGSLSFDYIVDPTAGPNASSIFANDATIGTVDWTNPSWVNSSDNNNASIALANGVISHYLKLTGFGFNIPTNSVVTGINVSILRGANNSGRIRDRSIRLVKNGVINGTDLNRSDVWPATLTYQDYGNSTYKWGQGFTPSDINNNTGFGVVIAAQSNQTSRMARIDFVRITVSYSNPPVITTVTPLNTTYPARVNFNVTLDSSGSWCAYSLDGAANVSMSNMSATNFNFTNTTMTNGKHNVTFACNNTYGAMNSSSTTTSFTVDSIYPNLNMTYPTNTTYTTNLSVLNYTYSDTNPGYCVYSNSSGTWNSTNIQSAGNNFSNVVTKEGGNTFTVYCNDSVGNLNSSSVTFFKDTIYPQLNLTYPLNSTYNTNISVLNYTYIDSNPGYCIYSNSSGSWNSTNIQTAGNNFTSVVTKEGGNTFTVYCNDTLGNLNSSTISFFKDTIYPAINFTSPTLANATNISQNFIYVNLTANDTNEANVTFRLYNSSGSVNVTTFAAGIRTINWTSLSDNNYYYNVTINDTSSNINFTETKKITLDTHAPNATLFAPANNSYKNNATQNFTANVTDNLGIKNATLNIYNSSNSLVNSSNMSFASGLTSTNVGILVTLSNDVYKWFYNIFDWAGNSFTTGNYTVTIDTIKSNVNLTYPLNTTYTANISIINYTYSDTNPGNCWYSNSSGSWNSTNIQVAGNNFSSVVTKEGSNTFTVYCNDSAGNLNSSSITFLIDTIYPNLNLTYPLNITYINVTTLNYTYNDTNPGYCWYSNNSGSNNYSFQTAGTNFTNISVTDGPHIFTVYCNDTAGNLNSSSISFSQNSSPRYLNMRIGTDSTTGGSGSVAFANKMPNTNYSPLISSDNYAARAAFSMTYLNKAITGHDVKSENDRGNNFATNFEYMSIEFGDYYYNGNMIKCNINSSAIVAGTNTINFPSNFTNTNYAVMANSIDDASSPNINFIAASKNASSFNVRIEDDGGNTLATNEFSYCAFTKGEYIVSGMYIKAGSSTTASSGDTTVTFTTAFANTSYSVVAIANSTSGTPCAPEVVTKSVGSFTIHFEDDGANNCASKNFDWIAITQGELVNDENPPNATLMTPQNNSITNNISINYTLNATDDISLKNATLFIYNQTSNTLINQSNASMSGTQALVGIVVTLTDGIYKWFYNIFDNSGRSFTTTNNTLTIDTVKPNVNLTYPQNKAYTINVSVINYTYYDTYPGYCWYSNSSGTWNSTNIQPAGNNFTNVITKEGSNNFTVYCNDTAGNINSSSVTFTRDFEPPNINITYPQNTSYNTHVTELDYIVTDSGAGPALCWYSLDNGATNSSTYDAGTNFTGLVANEGSNNTWTVYCMDYVGRVNSSNVSFMQKTIYPALTIISPSNGTIVPDVTPTLNVSVDQNVSMMWYTTDNGTTNNTICNNCNGTQYKFMFLKEGNFEVKVYANDSVNNIANATSNFTVDMNFTYNDSFDDNSSILTYNKAVWNTGNITYTGTSSSQSINNLQSGSATLNPGDTAIDIPITSVNTSASWFAFSYRTTNTDPSNDLVLGNLSSSTNIHFQRNGAGTNPVYIKWYLAEFTSGPNIQRGTIPVTTATVTNRQLNPINTSSSFPFQTSWKNTGTTNFGTDDFLKSTIKNSTNLQIYSQAALSDTLSYQVIDYPGAKVQNGSFTMPTGTSIYRLGLNSSVDLTKSFVIASWSVSGNANQNQYGLFVNFANSSGLYFERKASNNRVLNVSWYVVEFTGGESVKSGVAHFNAGVSSLNVPFSDINTSQSIAFLSGNGIGGMTNYNTGSPGNAWFTADITNATNLNLQRALATNPADVEWYVVEFGSTTSGDVTSYPINTTSQIMEIKNVTWVDSGTDSSNTINVKVSSNNGNSWFDATNNQGISNIDIGSSLVYKVFFSAVGSNQLSLLDLNITWTNISSPPPDIIINSPVGTIKDVTPTLNVTLDSIANSLWYSVYNGTSWSANTTLCTSCTGTQTTFLYLKEGNFTVNVYANNKAGELSQSSSDFIIGMNYSFFDDFYDDSSLTTLNNVDWNIGSVSYTNPGQASIKRVQSGSSIIPGGSTGVNVSISAIITNSSFLVFNYRVNSSDPGDFLVYGNITNATNIRFYTSSAQSEVPTITIQWYVVEFNSGVYVQRGTITQSDTTTTPIDDVDLTESFPLISHQGSGTFWGANHSVRDYLVDSSDLETYAYTAPNDITAWQVIDYQGTNVQSGEFSLTGTTDTETLDTPVDLNKSFIIATWAENNTVTPATGGLFANFSDSSHVYFERKTGTTRTLFVSYYVVEFTGGESVQSGSVHFNSGDFEKNISINSITQNKSIAFLSGNQKGGMSNYSTDDNPGIIWFTANLTNSTNLRLNRDNSTGVADVEWFVVDFSPPSSGNFISYNINTTETITGIDNVSWSDYNTNENDTIQVQVSADNGTNWYNATKNQGISQIQSGNSLVYKTIFNTLTPQTTISLINMTINWSKIINPPPSIYINTPETGTTTNDVTPPYNITLNGTATSLWYTTNNGLTNTTICTFCNGTQTGFLYLKEGNFTLNVYASNSVGNKTTNSSTFLIDLNKNFYDTYDDNSSITTLTKNVTGYLGNVTYSGNASGNLTSYSINTTQNIVGISNITWSTNGTDANNRISINISVNNGVTWYNTTSGRGVTLTTPGNSLVYKVFFTTNSSSRNLSILDINITWTTAPIISILYPANNTIYGANVTNISLTISNSSALSICKYNLNRGGGNVTFNCLQNISGITSIEGSNNWTIYANDSVNSLGSSTVFFTIDTISPNITFINQTNDDNQSINSTNPLLQGQNLTINVNATDSNLAYVWIVVWETVKDGTIKFTSLLSYVSGSLYHVIIPTDINWQNLIYNYTIYANDTVNHTSQLDNNFSLLKMNITLDINPNISSGASNLTLSGHLNFSNSTNLVNYPINLFFGGNLLFIENLTPTGTYQYYLNNTDTLTDDFNSGIYYHSKTDGENITLSTGNTTGNYTKILDAGARVRWNNLVFEYTGAACSGIATYQDGDSNSYNSAEDSYISSGNDIVNYGSYADLMLGISPSTYRSLIKFNNILGYGSYKIPYNSTIIQANITVYVNATGANPTVYEVLENWSESEVTYNNSLNSKPWSSTGCLAYPSRASSSESTFTTTALGFSTFNITNAMKRWANQTSANNGIVIEPAATVELLSSEYSNQTRRPLLRVKFNSNDCTSATFYVRTSNDKITWTNWTQINSGGSINDTNTYSRYLQYKVELTSFNSTMTPYIGSVFVNYTAVVTDSNGDYNYNYSTTSVPGAYTILANSNYKTISANDSKTFNITDSIPPNATLIKPYNNTFTNNATQNMTVNATDDMSLGKAMLVIYNSTNNIVNQTNKTISGNKSYYGMVYTFLYDDIFNWFYDIFDSAGNSFTTDNFTITIDRVVPNANITYPLNITYYDNVNYLNYTYNDTYPGYCWYSNNSGTWNSSIKSPGDNFTDMSSKEGLNNWTLYCNDSAGNLNASSIAFTKDTLLPQINFTNPTPTSGTISSIRYVSINVSINEAILSEIKFNWNGTNFTILDGSLLLMMNFDNNSLVGESSSSNYSYDSSNYQKYGTCFGMGAGCNYTTGKYQKALSFNGNNSYVNLSTTISINKSSFTSMSWFKTSSNNDTKIFSFNASDHLMQINTSVLSICINGCSKGTTNVSNNQWHFVTVMGNTSGIYAYLDGNQTPEINQSASSSLMSGIPRIGADGAGLGSTAPAHFFNGLLDEVRIYNKSMTNAEILEMYFLNLQKYNSLQYYLTINQSKNKTSGLDDGTYTYFASAKDSQGNESMTETRTITIGSNAPQVNLTYPLNDSYAINVSIINYTYSTNYSNGYCWYSNDTGVHNYSIQSAGNNFTNVISKEASNTWTVYCNDSAGNKNSSTVTFYKNTLPPTINITYPTNKSYGVNVTNLNYTASDATGVSRCWYSNNSGIWNSTTQNPGTNWTGLNSSEGSNILTVYCNDTDSNLNSFNVSFTQVTNYPTINQIYSTNESGDVGGQVDLGHNITFFADVTDTVGISKVWVIIWKGVIDYSTIAYQGFLNFVSGNIYSASVITNATFPVGTANYTINVNNTGGNKANQSDSFPTFDNTPPSAFLNSPINGKFVGIGKSLQYFASNFTDNLRLINTTFYLWNSTGDIINQTNSTISGYKNFTNISSTLPYPGNFTWNYFVCDNIGFCSWNDTNWTIIYDITPPQVNLTYPDNISIYIINVSTINYTYSDEYPGYCWYSNDTGVHNYSVQPAGNNFTNVITKEGSNTFMLYCNDSAGNQNSSNVTFIKDTVVPVINITYPINNKNYSINVSTLNYTYNSANPGFCWYSNDTGENNYSIESPGTNWTNMTSTEGANNWIIYCNDTIGLIGSTNVTFNKDTTSPNITNITTSNISLITGGVVSLGQNVTINAYVNDSSSLSKVWTVIWQSVVGSAKIYQGFMKLISGNLWSLNVTTNTSFAFENVNFTVYANDTLGNQANSSSNFTTVDTTPPQVNLINPANGKSFGVGYSVQNFSANFSDFYRLQNATLFVWNSSGYVINQSDVNISGIFNISNISLNLPYTNNFSWNYYSCDYYSNCNWASGNWSFIYDIIPPNVNMTYPRNISYYVNVTAINYTVSDNLQLNKCWWSNNSGIWNSSAVNAGTNWTGITQSQEGWNNWTVYCNDTAGNMNSSTIAFFKNTGLPSITIIYPQNTTYNFNVTDLNYTADATYGISKCWYSNNSGGNNYSIQDSGTNWTGIISNEGSNKWTVFCNDTTGALNSISVTFIKNTIPPNVNVIYPLNISYGINVSTLNYTVSDIGGLAQCWYSNNTGIWNSTPPVNAGTNFSGIISSEGSNTWTVYCNDTGGNENSSTKTFFKDTVYPLIQFEDGTEINGTNFSRNWIFINVSVIEINEMNITFTLYNNTKQVNVTTLGAGNRTFNWTNLPDSLYYYNVSVYDTAANRNFTETRTITLDTHGPNGTLTPPNNTYTSNVTLNLTVNATDNIGLYNSTLYLFNSSDNLINQTSFAISGTQSLVGIVVTLSDGIYKWFYNLIDFTQNTYDTQNNTLTIDTKNPNLNLTYPLNTSYTINVSTLNYTYNDTNPGYCWYSNSSGTWNSTTIKLAGQNFTNVITGEGANAFTIYCNDSAGNTNSSNVSFFKDSILPNINITYPLNTTYAINVSTLNYTYNDTNPGYCWYSNSSGIWNSTDIQVAGNNFTNVITKENSNIFTLYCNDSYGNTNSNTITFLKDTINPAINLTYPQNLTYTTNVSTVNYTYNDSNPGYCWYSNDSGSWNSTIKSAGQNFTNVITLEGSNTFTLYCNDSVGNTNSSNVTFFKDTIKPNLNLTYPLNTTYTINVSTLNYTYVDSNPGYCWYSNSSGTWNSTDIQGAGNNFTDVITKEGPNIFTVYCNDSAGNTNSSNVSFYKDTIPPNITNILNYNQTGNISGFVNFGDNVTINATITDNLNLNSVWLVMWQNVIGSNIVWQGFMNYIGSFYTVAIQTNNSWSNGVSNFTIYANDSLGNQANSSSNFSIGDVTPPKTYLKSPPNRSLLGVGQSGQYFVANFTDNYLLQNYTLYIWNSSLNVVNTTSADISGTYNTSNVTFILPYSDTFTWNYYACDNSSNCAWNSTNYTLIYDIIPPSINITYPQNSTYNINVSTLNYTYDDYNSGYCWYSNNSGLTNSTIKSAGQNFTNVITEEGTNTLTLYCNDTTGNTNSSNVSFFKDTIIPNIQFGFGTEINATNISQDFIYINVTINETNFANITYNLYNNTNGATLVNSTNYSSQIYTINFTNLPDAIYYYNVTVYDIANNKNNTETRTITLDTHAPNATLLAPLNNTVTNNITQNMSVNSTDNIMLLNATLFVFNSSNSLINQTTRAISGTAAITGIVYQFIYDDVFTWFYQIFDSANNRFNTENNTITIDRVLPGVNIVYPQNTTYIINVSTMNYTVSDNINISKCWYSNNSGIWNSTIKSAGQNFTNTISIEGSNTWTLYCNDTAGNINSSTITFFKDSINPNINISFPLNATYNLNVSTLNYTYSDANPGSCWYSNSSGTWNSTPAVSPGTNFTNVISIEGSNNWMLYCNDTLGNTNSSNISFFKDTIYPLIEYGNGTTEDGLTAYQNWIYVNVTVNETNEMNITFTLFNDTNTLTIVNRTTYTNGQRVVNWTNLSPGLYYYNVSVVDVANNINTTTTRTFNYTLPDFSITSGDIVFNTTNPVENETILINATIHNLGGVNMSGVIVKFYNGDPTSGGTQIGTDQNLSISKYSSNMTTMPYTLLIGLNNIFVLVDPPLATNGSYRELNESNNQANQSITTSSWSFFYGNILNDSEFSLEDSTNNTLQRWLAGTIETGNIYVTQSGISISWSNLLSIGKNTTGGNATNDFNDIDTLLNSTSFNDSTYKLFTNSGTIKDTRDIIVFNRNIASIPIVNSTNNSNFVTGILWDTSTDTNGEYDTLNKENLVFITSINKNQQGAYGIYDYEIRIPAKLRNYNNSGDPKPAVFYAELK